MDTPATDDLDETQLARIGVTVAHPFGDVPAPLTEWIAHGPGARPKVRPVAAWDWATGRPLPITAIPFRYRNTIASRRWLAVTGQPSPWAQLPPEVPPEPSRAGGWFHRAWRRLVPPPSAPRSPLPTASPTALLATGPVAACALSADGQTIVAAGWEAELRWWRNGGRAAAQQLPGPPGITSCAMSADGSTVVACGADGAVWCWDGATARRRHRLPGATDWVLACAVSADGALIAATGETGIVWVWDGRTGTLRHRLPGHDGPGVDCGVSADGAIIGSVGADGTARVWQATTGAVQWVGRDPLWGTDLTACAVDPTGQRMVVTGATMSMLVDTQLGTDQGVAGELAAVRSQFSADGQLVLTVGRDGWVELRDDCLEPRTHWVVDDRLTGGAIAAGGAGLVISGNHGLYWYATAPVPPQPEIG
ncbi:MAG TPA: hypothetical protein VGE07_11355 [Herpetosiphonaceae bacterium]